MKETHVQHPPPPDHHDRGEEGVPVWDCGSPLYDSYELVSLNHVIDRHIMVLPSLSGSRKQERVKSSRFSHAPNLRLLIPSFFSAANPSKDSSAASDAAASKKGRSGSWSCGVAVAFLSKITERNAWKRRIYGGGGGEKEGKHKNKEVKFSNNNIGISKVCDRIN